MGPTGEGRGLLRGRFTDERLGATLLPREAWHPFPRSSERGPWEALPRGVREATVEEIPVADARLRPVWGERIWRVVLTAKATGETGAWTIEMSAGSRGSGRGAEA
jgi:hypothetical protein